MGISGSNTLGYNYSDDTRNQLTQGQQVNQNALSRNLAQWQGQNQTNQAQLAANTTNQGNLWNFQQGMAGIAAGQQTAMGQAGLQAQTAKYNTDVSNAAQQRETQMQTDASRFASQTAADANKYNSDIGLKGIMYPQDLKQSRFGQIFPMFQDAWSKMNGNTTSTASFGGGGGFGGSFGGGAGGGGDVLSKDQIKQQVNAGVAANDSRTSGQMTQMGNRLAGQGYGGKSPLAQALGAQIQGTGMMADSDTQRQVPIDAATLNAQHQVGMAQANAGPAAAAINAQANNYQANLQYQSNQRNALLQALSGLVG